jgi:hypothetical protein
MNYAFRVKVFTLKSKKLKEVLRIQKSILPKKISNLNIIPKKSKLKAAHL